MTADPDFPGILGQIADAIGKDSARALAMALGGQRVSIAKNPGPSNPIAAVVGVEAAKVIANEIGWGEVALPLGPASRPARIKAMLAQGLSHNRIAAEIGCTVRTVEYHAQQKRQHNGQPDLFD
jgi:hypothetical protein